MKKILIALIVSFFLVSCNGASAPTDETEKETNKTKSQNIVTTLVPLASITNTIGGDTVEVYNLVGAGQSPHNFELSTKDLVAVEDTNDVITVGMEHIDGFLDKAITEKNVLTVADGIELLEMEAHEHEHGEHENKDEEHSHEDEDHTHEAEDHEHEDEHEEEEHNEEHADHELDPHVWNSPVNAQIISLKIADFLGALSPENKELYAKNAESFNLELKQILDDFAAETEGKKQNYFIVFHDAHNYLLRDFGIDAEKKLVFRTSVLSEPDSEHMQELIDEIELHDVQVAFVEPQFKNENFEALAKKYGIKISVLDPLGTSIDAGAYRKNVENNAKSLKNIFE